MKQTGIARQAVEDRNECEIDKLTMLITQIYLSAAKDKHEKRERWL